jgi:outer membrane protein OmpA-like peptidoglycan-associated protein
VRTLRALTLCWFMLALGLSTTLPSRSAAQSPWSGRATLGAAMMLSNDQVKIMQYDQAGFLGSLALSRRLISRLSAQWMVRGGGFMSEKRTGGLLASTLGLRLHSTERELMPYLSLDGGVAFTGKLTRPYVSASIGVDWRAHEYVTLGPIAGVDNVVQWNGPGYSTDALFLWIGLSMTYGKASPQPKPQPNTLTRIVTRERERVVQAPPEGPKELELLIERSLGPSPRMELLAPVLFALDSDQLEPIGIAMLHEVTHTLRTRPEILRLEVQGYADARGSAAHNEALSQRRAERVRNWLIEHGIAPERLSVAARGATLPVEAEHSEGAYEQNRRVIFRVLELAEP